MAFPYATLCVQGVKDGTNRHALQDQFEEFGKVMDVTITANKQMRGQPDTKIALVEFKHRSDARKAMQALNGRQVQGKCVMIRFARSAPGVRPASPLPRHGAPMLIPQTACHAAALAQKFTPCEEPVKKERSRSSRKISKMHNKDRSRSRRKERSRRRSGARSKGRGEQHRATARSERKASRPRSRSWSRPRRSRQRSRQKSRPRSEQQSPQRNRQCSCGRSKAPNGDVSRGKAADYHAQGRGEFHAHSSERGPGQRSGAHSKVADGGVARSRTVNRDAQARSDRHARSEDRGQGQYSGPSSRSADCDAARTKSTEGDDLGCGKRLGHSSDRRTSPQQWPRDSCSDRRSPSRWRPSPG